MADNKGLRVNEQIRVREVRLIDDEGEQKVLSLPWKPSNSLGKRSSTLLKLLQQQILLYVKYLTMVSIVLKWKKLRDSKEKQKLLKLKEIRMQPKIGSGDLDFKSKHVKEFLAEGIR